MAVNDSEPVPGEGGTALALRVIHEDACWLVVNKPAGLVCHPTKRGPASSLIGRVRWHLAGLAPGHLINRLDRETSGVVLVAKDLETTRSARKAWEQRQVRKEYWAIVHGAVAEASGWIEARLGRDEASQVAIKDCVRVDGVEAVTRYEVVERVRRSEGLFTWLRLFPQTGRKHQLRIHLAHLGHPIVGDKLYGLDEDCYLALVQDRLTEEQRHRLLLPFHALHARSVTLPPELGGACYEADPEPWLRGFMRGGDGRRVDEAGVPVAG